MTNAEKFKTAKERAKAHLAWCDRKIRQNHANCGDIECTECAFLWLDLEADEEKPLPCPFCGGECRPVKNRQEQYVVGCDCCCYASQDFSSSSDAIAAHNRVAHAAMESDKKEEN